MSSCMIFVFFVKNIGQSIHAVETECDSIHDFTRKGIVMKQRGEKVFSVKQPSMDIGHGHC